MSADPIETLMILLTTRLRTLCLLACLSVGSFVGAAESVAAPKSTSLAPATPAKPVGDDRSLLMRETKQYLAQMTEERNQLREANETYATRQGLLIGYGVVMTVLAGWLMMRTLSRRTVPARATKADTDAFAAADVRSDTAVTVRKNATITIRNGSTQQAEVTDQVQTRRAFVRTDTGSQRKTEPGTGSQRKTETGSNRNTGTGSQRRQETATAKAPPVRTPTPAKPATVIAPELDPVTPLDLPVPTAAKRSTSTASTQRPTVRVEQQASDRLAPIDVVVKPGTTRTYRTPKPITER